MSTSTASTKIGHLIALRRSGRRLRAPVLWRCCWPRPQYSVHVNYTVMRDVVKALDGITVTIESRDPRGQMDSNFDWKCKGGNAYASQATMIKNCPPSGHLSTTRTVPRRSMLSMRSIWHRRAATSRRRMGLSNQTLIVKKTSRKSSWQSKKRRWVAERSRTSEK